MPLIPLLLLATLALAARADDGSPDLALEAARPEEPIPIDAQPWPVLATAYLLPPQDPAWLTSEDPFRSCEVQLLFEPARPLEVKVGSCPATMVEAAAAASLAWRFEPSEAGAGSGATCISLCYVVRYDATLGLMTLHVAVDPGEEAAFDGTVGPPGVKLVRPARVLRQRAGRLPRAARKAGLEPGSCALRLVVDPAGKPGSFETLECGELVSLAAARAAARWRFAPRVADGVTEPERLTIEVELK